MARRCGFSELAFDISIDGAPYFWPSARCLLLDQATPSVLAAAGRAHDPPSRGNFQTRLARAPGGLRPHSLSHRKPPESGAKASPKAVSLARLGRWKAASAISTRTPTKQRSWGEMEAGGVSTLTSSRTSPWPNSIVGRRKADADPSSAKGVQGWGATPTA